MRLNETLPGYILYLEVGWQKLDPKAILTKIGHSFTNHLITTSEPGGFQFTLNQTGGQVKSVFKERRNLRRGFMELRNQREPEMDVVVMLYHIVQ